MLTRKTISKERLKECVSYDLETGQFTNIVRRGHVMPGTKAGSAVKTGYIVIKIDGQDYFAHRLAFLYVHGYLPEIIDHINHDKADNRISNLREVTQSENFANKPGKHGKTSSRFKGVFKSDNVFIAVIVVNRKRIELGRFKNEFAAALAYDFKSWEIFGNKSRRNFYPFVI